jgi:hypothetical protein
LEELEAAKWVEEILLNYLNVCTTWCAMYLMFYFFCPEYTILLLEVVVSTMEGEYTTSSNHKIAYNEIS